MSPKRVHGVLLACAVMVASGCSDRASPGEPGEQGKPAVTQADSRPGQVAARINGEEVTVHQINDRLAAWAPPSADTGPQSQGVGMTLNRLVELTLLRQEAEAQGLAQRPDVLRALQAARAEVLARALAQQIGEEETPPAPHLIRRYYDEHPEAFARRRVFHIKEVRAAMAGDESGRLAARLDGYREPQALAQMLDKAGHRGVMSHLQVASDQLPLPQLRRLQQLGPNQPLLIEDGAGIRVWWLQATVDQPLEWNQAQEAIERLLLTRARADRLRRELERLRERSTIEYKGDFARWAPPAAASAQSGGEATQEVSTGAPAR